MNDGTYPRLIFLLSHERSGSHLLQEILRVSGHIESYDEVCNFTSNPTSSLKWHNFIMGVCKSDSKSLGPSREKRSKLFRDYATFLQNAGPPEQPVIIDIKYGHMHNFDEQWYNLMHCPLLLEELIENRIKTIHLFRANVIQAICSQLLADKTGIYHSSERMVGASMINVYPGTVIYQANMLRSTQEAIKRFLHRMLHIELTYEKDLVSGEMAEPQRRKLEEYLNLTTFDWKPSLRLQKVAPSLPEYIENFDELKRVAIARGMGSMLE